jgi:ketosteroid isomerase-like protein
MESSTPPRDTAWAMSQENVEIVRALFEAWNTGDMDTLRERYDPDVIMRAPEGWPEPGPWVGRNAVMRQFDQLRDTWDDDALEPISGLSAAGDRVLVRVFWRVVGHGPHPNLEFTITFTMRKGRVYFVELFWDHADALDAAGLSE